MTQTNIESYGLKFEHKKQLFLDLAQKYNEFVIIGLTQLAHSHYYVQQDIGIFFEKMGLKWRWLEDTRENIASAMDKTLVIIPDAALAECQGKSDVGYFDTFVQSFNDSCHYLFYRGARFRYLPPSIKMLRLYEYRKNTDVALTCREQPVRINDFINFYPQQKILIQPWGATLLENEFLDPVTSRKTKDLFFVGTLWGDEASKISGNRCILKNLQAEVAKKGYRLCTLSGVIPEINAGMIRYSFASLAPGSVGHDENTYLQCRVFKNISYGRMTFTDVRGFRNILGKSFVPLRNLAEAIDVINMLTPALEMEICHLQQERIRDYTYLDMWINILWAFERLYGG